MLPCGVYNLLSSIAIVPNAPQNTLSNSKSVGVLSADGLFMEIKNRSKTLFIRSYMKIKYSMRRLEVKLLNVLPKIMPVLPDFCSLKEIVFNRNDMLFYNYYLKLDYNHALVSS